MKCNRQIKIGVLISVIVLLIVQFVIFPDSYYSIPNPLTIFKNFTVDKTNSSATAVTRWLLKAWDVVHTEDRNLEVSKKSTDILLLVRKLVVFSIREVNQQLAGTPCTPCWANPLSVTEFSEIVLATGEKEYTLKFEVHPGAVLFESTVRLRRDAPNATHPYPSADLFFVRAERLDHGADKHCHELFRVNDPMRALQVLPICLCPEELANAESVTATARKRWNNSDPELPTWTPDRNVSVPDYIRFSTMDLYLKSPVTQNRVGFCGPEVKMLVFISSAPTHFSTRASIRSTFGNFSFLESHGARLLFLFGTVKDEEMQTKIHDEFQENNDIVQADFEDSYHNLTLSHLSMYNWVVTQCKSQGASMPRWVLKADDDFFLNVPLALRIVAVNPNAEMIGMFFCGTQAVRDVSYMTKYYVPRYMYAPDYYAGYLSGVTYLVRTDVLEPMLKASLTTPIIHMDDAYVMGLLTREVGIRPAQSRLITYEEVGRRCDIVQRMCNHVGNATLEKMWADFQRLSQKRCKLAEHDLKVPWLTDQDIKSCFF